MLLHNSFIVLLEFATLIKKDCYCQTRSTLSLLFTYSKSWLSRCCMSTCWVIGAVKSFPEMHDDLRALKPKQSLVYLGVDCCAACYLGDLHLPVPLLTVLFLGSASSPVAMALFHGETHTLATTAGKIIIYTLATTMSSPHSGGNPRLARSGSGRAPLHGRDPYGEEDPPQVDEVQSQLEQLVDLLEQYFHPSNNGRSVCVTTAAVA